MRLIMLRVGKGIERQSAELCLFFMQTPSLSLETYAN